MKDQTQRPLCTAKSSFCFLSHMESLSWKWFSCSVSDTSKANLWYMWCRCNLQDCMAFCGGSLLSPWEEITLPFLVCGWSYFCLQIWLLWWVSAEVWQCKCVEVLHRLVWLPPPHSLDRRSNLLFAWRPFSHNGHTHPHSPIRSRARGEPKFMNERYTACYYREHMCTWASLSVCAYVFGQIMLNVSWCCEIASDCKLACIESFSCLNFSGIRGQSTV